MRTESNRDRVATFSRRAFVIGAGSAVVASTTGTAAGTGDPPSLTVEATEPYFPTVRGLVDAFDSGTADLPVEVKARATDGAPADRVGEGPADVLVSGDPVTSVAGTDPESGLKRDVTVHGWATLAARTDDWYRCLTGSTLNDRVEGDPPVETWSESDWESVQALEDGGDGSAGERCAGLTSNSDERTSLVRGVRSAQYASGQGGVGYYEVTPVDVGAPSNARTRGDGVVPLIRLGYVYVDESALDRKTTGTFLRFYRRRSPSMDDVAHYSDAGFDVGGEASRA